MDYSILSEKEILKYAEPVTDLEIALFGLLKDGLDCAAEAEQDADRAREEISDLEDVISELNHDIGRMQRRAIDAIDFIQEKEFDGKDELIKLLDRISND